jgi:hypothetical protein
MESEQYWTEGITSISIAGGLFIALIVLIVIAYRKRWIQ